MAGRVAPTMEEVRIDVNDAKEPSSLLPKATRLESVSTFGLWRYANSVDLLLITFAVTASLGLGSIYPLGIRTLGDLLTQLLTGTSGSGGLTEKANLFAVLGAGSFLATYISRALWIISAERIVKKISLLYLEKVLRQDMTWFDKLQDESLTARLSNEVPYIRNGIGENASLLCSALGTIIICTVISLLQNWKLTLIILALLPLLIGAGVFIVRNDSKLTKITSDAFAKASNVAEQALSGVRTVYAFSLQRRFKEKYAAKLNAVRDADIKKSAVSGFATGFFTSLLFLIFAFAFWLGSQMVKNQQIKAPEAVVVLLSMMILASSLMKVPAALSVMAVAQSAATSIYATIEMRATIDDRQDFISEKSHTLESVVGDITFNRVSFSYPARPDIPILQELSIDIKAGTTVAFVGGSGSGKSTTIALLQRFYDPAFGSISVDGRDVKSLNLTTLRKHIGVVGQEPVLFALTIKQNILMGTHEGVTPAYFVTVCRMAQCHFVENFPLGYDTLISPGMLSGGQKQRIAIARALIKNPKILLLDEATSALDTTSERLVQKALDAASEGRTTIVIAHRLSTIRNANLICVMERGVLVEKGTHEELYALNGVYTQLVNKQKLSVTKNNGVSAETEGQGPLPQESGSSENISKILQQLMLTLESPAQLVQEARARLEEEKALHLQSIGDSPEGMFTKVYHALRPERKILLLGTACAGLNGLVFPGFAFLLGFIIQEIMQPLDIMLKYGMANMFISCLLVVAVFALLGTWGQTSLFGKANANLTSRFRLAMFENILTSEMGFFDSKVNAVGTLVNKLGGVAQVPCFVTDVWGGTANLTFTAIYGVGLSMVFCVPLAGVLVCLLPFMFLLAWWQCVAISRFAAASKESLDQSTQVATESMREVKTLKTLIREEFAVCRYEAFLDRPFQLSMRNAVLDSIAYALQASSIMFTIALGLFVGQKFLEKGIITEFWRVTVVILGMCVSMVSLASSASLAQAWAKGRFAALTTYAILERRTAIDPLKKGIIPKHFSAGFHFNNLVFQYPTSTQRIFNGHFTLTGAENKSLALVGPSGSGKSTVIGLLQRWYDPIRGKALLGNIPIADYDIMEGLRSNMALVGQEPVLFDMSIAENIAWGSEKPVTQAEIEAAARQANAHTFVMNMPQGYDTRVGNKGDQLSGGQKQRIAIARALIRKPKLLLLDEATSALDSTSEHEVQNAIDGASVGRTTVTIAHRLSTIKNVDCIAVVTGGQIVEAGRHDELVAQNGVYADLCRKQGL